MPSLLVIRLHPVEPISGDDFTNYLDGLTITAFEISFNNQAGTQIGQAQYLPPNDPATRIVQHKGGDRRSHQVTIGRGAIARRWVDKIGGRLPFLSNQNRDE